MEAKYTATPWAITGQPQNVTDTCGYTVTDANGEFVAEFDTYTDAIAAVRACNAHDDLVRFAQFVLRGIKSGHVTNASFIDSDLNGESIEVETLSSYADKVLTKAGAL